MNFMADESCAAPVICALREAGHDVVAIAEVARGAPDEQVLERALSERRVIITEDHDFGELVYARGRSSPGVILVRFHSRARLAKPPTVVEAVAKLGPPAERVYRGGTWPRAAWRNPATLNLRIMLAAAIFGRAVASLLRLACENVFELRQAADPALLMPVSDLCGWEQFVSEHHLGRVAALVELDRHPGILD
jgi:predicted nuclease of predicted toxin-antitoxin system